MNILNWLKGVKTPNADLEEVREIDSHDHRMIECLAFVVESVGGRMEVESESVRAMRGKCLCAEYTETGVVLEVLTEQQFAQKMADRNLPRN